MVQAIINISEKTNRTLNIVKATHALRTKSEAIDMLAQEYEKMVDERPLKERYVEKALKNHAEKGTVVGTEEDLRRRYE